MYFCVYYSFVLICLVAADLYPLLTFLLGLVPSALAVWSHDFYLACATLADAPGPAFTSPSLMAVVPLLPLPRPLLRFPGVPCGPSPLPLWALAGDLPTFPPVLGPEAPASPTHKPDP